MSVSVGRSVIQINFHDPTYIRALYKVLFFSGMDHLGDGLLSSLLFASNVLQVLTEDFKFNSLFPVFDEQPILLARSNS